MLFPQFGQHLNEGRWPDLDRPRTGRRRARMSRGVGGGPEKEEARERSQSNPRHTGRPIGIALGWYAVRASPGGGTVHDLRSRLQLNLVSREPKAASGIHRFRWCVGDGAGTRGECLEGRSGPIGEQVKVTGLQNAGVQWAGGLRLPSGYRRTGLPMHS
jgi:hypothetical protein